MAETLIKVRTDISCVFYAVTCKTHQVLNELISKIVEVLGKLLIKAVNTCIAIGLFCLEILKPIKC